MLEAKCPVCGTNETTTFDGRHHYICGYRRHPNGDFECGYFGRKSVIPTKCTCDVKELFWGGCKCGWLEIEKALKK